MMKYLDPKADLTFKKIFGNHPQRLISLLNALLPLSEAEQIHAIEYLPTELVPQLEGGQEHYCGCTLHGFTRPKILRGNADGVVGRFPAASTV